MGNRRYRTPTVWRWSSAFYYVLVFTVKERCVLFIKFVQFTLLIEIFLCKNLFYMPARNFKASLVYKTSLVL